ncbi:MAG: amidohydrolase [Synergistaceae bacterium]|nr:amidohydrolase [Synergistaceae bacterium]
MLKEIESLVEKHQDRVIEIRRDIHQNPELAMEETRTAQLVKEELEKLGLEVEEKVGKMGVVGLLRGKGNGKTLLLRADMDALPILEETDLDFKSKTDGKMHACGHDVHTSILLGVAKVLAELKDQFKGNIKFCFQPAEEDNPTGGARFMIEDGVLDNPKVDAAMALHIWPMPLGQVALRRGTMMAQSDRLFLTVKGKSSHGAEPHKGQDALVAAGHIITAIQTVISRNVDPMDSAVVTLGTIKGGSRYNVVCDKVTMEGTVRTFRPEVSELMPIRIKALAEGVAAGLDCQCDVSYVKGYSATLNDPDLTDQVLVSLRETLGAENVILADKPGSGGEDFSEFAMRVPSVYYWLGFQSKENEGRTILHNPQLLVDEKAIAFGMKTMAKAALDYLNS